MKKFKEFFSIIKKIIKAKSMIAIRCPICGSINITLVGEPEEMKEVGNIDRGEEYGIGCLDCGSVAVVREYWKDNSKKNQEEK